MTKLLHGAELASYIKERQARQVRHLRQAYGVYPKLAIIVTTPSPVTTTYLRLKEQYGTDILIDTEVFETTMADIKSVIEQCNQDPLVHGIILQLPLADPSQTDDLVNFVVPEKDVDGLGARAAFDPATPTAINWLLAGYNVELKDKTIVVVGQGRLVGAPLTAMWRQSRLNVSAIAEPSEDLASELRAADIVVTATGVPGLIVADMLAPGAVVVDAGTASENGIIVGDVAADVRLRNDFVITPVRGGVGPLTVAALFDNVITAAHRVAKKR